ncbi:MAG: heat shock protein HslJ [Pseudorhodobacter sp.]|jgi:heat shock protein HslJ
MISYVQALSLVFAAGLGPAWACDMHVSKLAQIVLTQTGPQTGPQTQRPNMSNGDTDTRSKVQGLWQITQIGTTKVPADLGLTLTFENAEARFFGGCNTISTVPRFGLHGFRFVVTGATTNVCDAQTMARETALTATISAVDLMTVGPENVLGFYNATNQLVLGAARIDL